MNNYQSDFGASEQQYASAELLSLMESSAYQNSNAFYRIPLGNRNGSPVIEDLHNITNLLVTGIPMSGKTTFIQAIITSLMLSHSLDEFKFACYDSKPLEYNTFFSNPYCLLKIDNNTPAQSINILIELLSSIHASSPEFESVVVLDDYSEMITNFGCHDSIVNLLKQSRRLNCHVILVTSMITSKVITQEIRSLVPNVISFRVGSKSLSRLIGLSEAERLQVPGKAMVQWNGMVYQCDTVFAEPEELDRLCLQLSFERKNSVSQLQSDIDQFSQTLVLPDINNQFSKKNDPLFDEVLDYITDVQRVSTSLLQRRFGIGYNRAVRLLDELENKGIIGPAQGSAPRNVYYSKDQFSSSSYSSTTNNEPVIKHYGINITCWIENDKIFMETSDVNLLPMQLMANVGKTIRSKTNSVYSFSDISLKLPLAKIEKVTFKRAKKDTGYLHLYFLPYSMGVTLTNEIKDEDEYNESFDIRIPFEKQRENEFIDFGKEIMRKGTLLKKH